MDDLNLRQSDSSDFLFFLFFFQQRYLLALYLLGWGDLFAFAVGSFGSSSSIAFSTMIARELQILNRDSYESVQDGLKRKDLILEQ